MASDYHNINNHLEGMVPYDAEGEDNPQYQKYMSYRTFLANLHTSISRALRKVRDEHDNIEVMMQARQWFYFEGEENAEAEGE